MVDNSTVDLQIPQGPITLTSIPSQGVSINSCFTHNLRGQSQDEKSHSKEYDHRAELSRWEVFMLKQLPQGSSRNDWNLVTDVTRLLMAFPTGLPKNVCFFPGKLSKIWKMPLPSTTPTMRPWRRRRTGQFKRRNKGNKYPLQDLQEHLIFDAFFVYSLMSPQKLMETAGYPKGQHPGRLGRKTGTRWMPPLQRPRKPWRRPVRKLIRLMSWRKKRMRSGEWVPKKCRWTEMIRCVYTPKKTEWKAQGFRNLRPWWQLLVVFLQLLQEFHGEIGDVTIKVYGEESHKFWRYWFRRTLADRSFSHSWGAGEDEDCPGGGRGKKR